MNVELLLGALGWCTVINIAMMLCWVLMFMFARDWIYRMHSRWFRMTPEQFDRIHYSGMAIYKLAIFIFNLVPYLALRIAT